MNYNVRSVKFKRKFPSWRNIFPQLERNISLTGEIYFLSYGKYVTKVTQKKMPPTHHCGEGKKFKI